MILTVLLAASLLTVPTQRPRRPDGATPSPPQVQGAKPAAAADETPVVTHHEITVPGKRLRYTATAGLMPIKTEEGVTEAHIFYVAYTLDSAAAAAARPLIFAFNGGPGSASVWLHLGAIGPKRVHMMDGGGMPPPPYRLEDNPDTWLDMADIVFIDPVGTGYSRAMTPDLGKKYWSVDGDIASVGEFIRMYLTRNERWTSPLFLAGESYGTTRAAGLSSYLAEHGIALNGIVLISAILNFQSTGFAKGHDLPYVLYLPSYTATAWYHHKLAPGLEQHLTRTLTAAENWAVNDYLVALEKGDDLTPAQRRSVVDNLARYTGLDRTYIDHGDLRIDNGHFCAELLRDENRTVGRLDSRFTGINRSGISERSDYDPSEAAARPPFTALFNQYVRADLGYKTDAEYYILGGGIHGPWDFGREPLDVSDRLRSAMVRNPYMKVFVAAGYFDFATPFFASEYTINHLGLDPALRANIDMRFYRSGHMVYIRKASLHRLKTDVSTFLANAINAKPIGAPGHAARQPEEPGP